MERENVEGLRAAAGQAAQGEPGGATGLTSSLIGMVVKLEVHFGHKTSAKTYWRVKITGSTEWLRIADACAAGILKKLGDTRAPMKTHWAEYYEIRRPDLVFAELRVSNRGNITMTRFVPDELRAPDDEVEAIKVLGTGEE
jgi:hypothetical protein